MSDLGCRHHVVEVALESVLLTNGAELVLAQQAWASVSRDKDTAFISKFKICKLI